MRISACILCTLFLAAVPQEPEIKSEPLSDTVLVLTGGGGTVTAVAGRDAVAVVDSFISPAAARKARKLIEEFSYKQIRYLVNTHYHYDHTFGNQVFADAAIIAHPNCVRRVREQYAERAAELAAAGVRVKQLEKKFRETVEHDSAKAGELKAELDRERRIASQYKGMVLTPAPAALTGSLTIELGNKSLQLLNFGPGHTDGDLVAYVPRDNLLIVGDLVFNYSIPYIDVDAGADILGWISVLEKLYEMCDADTRVVPGHGEVGTRQALSDMRDYLRDLWKAVGAARTAGKTLEQAKTEVKLENYSSYGRYESALASNVEAAWKLYDKRENR